MILILFILYCLSVGIFLGRIMNILKTRNYPTPSEWEVGGVLFCMFCPVINILGALLLCYSAYTKKITLFKGDYYGCSNET